MIKWDLIQGCKDGSYLQIDVIYHINELKNDHLNRCRKSFCQNSEPTYDKNSPESGYREKQLNIIKVIYDKPTAKIILYDEKLTAFPQRSGTRQECMLLPLLLNIVLEVLAIAINKKKK